jgi:hypothetical protein
MKGLWMVRQCDEDFMEMELEFYVNYLVENFFYSHLYKFLNNRGD